MNIAIICGSLRKDSINKKLMRAVIALAPSGMELVPLEIGNLPLFNQDNEQNPPPPVAAAKEQIAAADAVIIVTPEYNRSIPGVLKNAIDWASRPWGKNSFAGKVVAVMGATDGAIGTALAQSHLKQALLYLDCHVLGQPEFYLGGASKKFDEQGNLTDEMTKTQIAKVFDTIQKY